MNQPQRQALTKAIQSGGLTEAHDNHIETKTCRELVELGYMRQGANAGPITLYWVTDHGREIMRNPDNRGDNWREMAEE